ncbi:MAG: hypothetical protein HKN42_02000, partial [Granulosicoccus sp.]|nr:hypothetical protein [Granulosicoccus sp.]
SMPARGGSTYSDEEIQRAVEHLAMFEVSAEAAPAAVETGDAAAAAQSPSVAPASEEPASEESAAEAPASEESAADAPATETTATESSTTDAASAEAGAELVVGQVPDGLTDNIRGTVDGICASCHLAGVGGAPKNGDTAAWQERADKGLAVLTNSVINGLNVMPPRGASALTDEEIPVAIQYLMSK